MCGFAGIAGQTPSPEGLERALEAIAHRGPDGRGVYRGEGVGLAHTRLSIIDLSEGGRQPMEDAGTGVVIVFNGEIYNYRELKSRFQDDVFRGHSDTEVVLRLYLRYGVDCARMLRGMFAFAIWDPRTQALHLCRDRFGIKPLYYHFDGKVLIFGSEVKALIALGVPVSLNRRAVHDYLKYGYTAHSSETFFEGVLALEPGSVLSLRDGGIQKKNYWSPLNIAEDPEPDGDVEEDLWGLLQEVLQLHLISDVPVGISLSSGLDSQFIVRLLSQIGCGEFHTFTYGFEEPEYDEIIRSKKTRFPLPLKQHYLRTRPEEMLESLQQAIRYFEIPLGGLGSLCIYRLMQVARDVGIKVLLSGEGADEIFGGYKYYYYTYFRDLYESGENNLLQKELDAFTRTNGEHLEISGSEFQRQVLSGHASVRAPDGTDLGGYEFIGPALVECAEEVDRERRPEKIRGRAHLHLAMLRDLVQLKVPKLLWFQDRSSMAWGVETRVPFLDHKVVEFVYRLPIGWIIRDGVSKYLLKRLLQRFGGIDYSQTVKHYVVTPQREWLKGPLYGAVNGYLDEGVVAQSGLVDYAAWKRAYAEYAQSPELGNSFFVWKMVNLEAFLRAFLMGGRLSGRGR